MNPRLLATLLLIVPLLPVASARAQIVSLEALIRAGYGVVPLRRPRPNVLTAEGKLNGRDINFVVDTGWGTPGASVRATFDAGTKAERVAGMMIGAGGGTDRDLRRASIDSFRLGNVELKGVPVYFSTLGGLNTEVGRQMRADGFIGTHFLASCAAVIDLQNLRLYLRPPGTGRRVDLAAAMRGLGMTEVPLTRSANHLFAPAEANGVRGSIVLDTGAYLTSFDNRAAARVKASASSTRMVSQDLAGTQSRVERATLNSFHVGGLDVTERDVMVMRITGFGGGESAPFGLLGMDVLGRHGGVIDCGANRLYLVGRR